MSLRYLRAVLGFFQNALCITVGRSSLASARVVSAPPDLKKCMVNAVRSPALRACTLAPLLYLVLTWASPLMGVPVFGRPSGDPREKVPLRHVPSQCSPFCDVLLNCSYGAYGHTRSVVLYCHEVIGAVSHHIPPLEIKEAAFIW